MEAYIGDRTEVWEAQILSFAKYARHGRIQAFLLLTSVFLIGVSLCKAYHSYFRGYRRSIELLYRPPIAYELFLQLAIGSAAALSVISSVQATSSLLQSLLIVYILVLRFIYLILPSRTQIGSVLQLELSYHTSKLLGVVVVLGVIGDFLPSLILRHALSWQSEILARDSFLAVALAILFSSPRKAVRFEHATSIPMLCRNTTLAEKKEPTIISPEQICSPYAYWVSYGWLDKVVFNGWKRDLNLGDLVPIPYYDDPLLWLPKILKARRIAGSTLKTCIYLVRWELFIMWISAIGVGCCNLVPAFALNRLITFIENPEAFILRPGAWVALLFVSSMANSICFHHYIFFGTRLRVRVKISLVQEIFNKALDSINVEGLPSNFLSAAATRTDPEGRNIPGSTQPSSNANAKHGSQSGAGHILNLMSTDVNGVEEGRDLLFVLGGLPVIISLGIFFLTKLVGLIAAMSGLVVLIIGLALPGIFTKKMATGQRSVMQASDQRIAMVSEFISSVRIIKYFGWEPPMAAQIHKRRSLEQHRIWNRSLWAAASAWVAFTAPFTALFVIYAVYTLLGNHLSAATAFTCMNILDIIRAMGVWISEVTNKTSQCVVACKRLDNFFTTSIPRTDVPEGVPAFKKATFVRSPHGKFRLENLNVHFLVGRLNVVTGPTGCGKTSLLLSLLGETILESGTVTCPSDVGYVSQSAWLQSGTIHDNILFHNEYDESRYKSAIMACGLEQDFAQLPRGDLTDVAEQGVVLSGGQKIRVTLARAVFSTASTLLLDDIFSALDVHTAKHIFDELFRKDLLAGRTVILSTHSQPLIDAAGLVVALENGKIVSVTEKDSVFQTYLLTASSDAEKMKPGLEGEDGKINFPLLQNQQLEKTAKGRIPRSLCKLLERLFIHAGEHRQVISACTGFAESLIKTSECGCDKCISICLSETSLIEKRSFVLS